MKQLDGYNYTKAVDDYELLEKAVLDSIILNPDLMKNIKLDDKHFKTHRRLWCFIKECYKRFGTLDIPTMARVCPNASDMIDYVADILMSQSSYTRFYIYQEQLLGLYKNYEEVKGYYDLALKLYKRDITLDEYKKEVKYLIGDKND